MNTLLVTFLVVAVLAVSVNSAALEGPTSSCPDFCTYEYLPVCAIDDNCYRIYGNECTLKSDQCKNRKNLKTVPMNMCEDATATDEKGHGSDADLKMCKVE